MKSTSSSHGQNRKKSQEYERRAKNEDGDIERDVGRTVLEDQIFNRINSELTNNVPNRMSNEGGAVTEDGNTTLARGHAAIEKPSSFAQLVRTWESYMNDGSAGHFQPLQVFQQLSLCGPEDGIARITDSYTSYDQNNTDLYEPAVFRHTHSTPSQHTPSILDDEDEDELPPYGLEILNRSRSTPLSTSANSAFGTILKTAPYRHISRDRSAFTLPLQRSKPEITKNISRQTTFNPIQHDKDLEAELASIEVMELPGRICIHGDSNIVLSQPSAIISETSPSSRAARFLSDVSRNFRKRYKHRGGRDNPARPPSSSDDSVKRGDEETVSSRSTASSTSKNMKYEAVAEHKTLVSKTSQRFGSISLPHDDAAGHKAINPSLSHDTTYQQLDSDQDEDGGPFSREYVGIESPATVPSPVYHPMEDDAQNTNEINRVSIHVSSAARESPLLADGLYTAASPELAHIAADCSTFASQSNDSPGTSRCSATTYTSGHTTHGTATTFSSGQLSAISETDREVMEANKVGKLLQRGYSTSRGIKSDSLTTSIPLSSSRNVRYREYVELSDSPSDLREGANVPAERFFTFPDSYTSDKRALSRRKNSSSSKKSSTHSPTAMSNSSVTTNSSASSSADAPPTFVSYLDRKLTSDLSFMRESTESSSPRADDTKRESSPAEMVGYSDVVFEEAKAPRNSDSGTTSKKPRPIWPTKGLHLGRRVRSLPPRSPHKGARTPTTPPPRGGGGSVSPAYSCLSPPRNIVDHRIDPNVSKPSVVIRAPVSSRPTIVQNEHHSIRAAPVQMTFNRISEDTSGQIGHEVVRIGTGYDMARGYSHSRLPRGPSPLGFRSRTYHEHSIEILKTDSKDDSSPTLLVDST